MNHFRIPLWRSAVVLLGLTSIASFPSLGQRPARFDGIAPALRSASAAVQRSVADNNLHTSGRPGRYTVASEPPGQLSQEGRCAGCFPGDVFSRREGRGRFEDRAFEIRHAPGGEGDGYSRGNGSRRSLVGRETESTDALTSTGFFEAMDSFCQSLLKLL